MQTDKTVISCKWYDCLSNIPRESSENKTNKRLSRVASDNLLKNISHMPEIPVIKYCENNIEFYLAIKYIKNLGREYNKVSL